MKFRERLGDLSMSLKSSAFQGIVTLNQNVADQLEEYLQAKEAQIAAKVFNVFLSEVSQGPVSYGQPVKISQLPTFLQRKLDQARSANFPTLNIEEWEWTKRKTSAAFWGYLELLEEFSTEFFQQIDQGSVEVWNVEFVSVIKQIKETLSLHLEAFQKTLTRVEQQLDQYRLLCHENTVIFRLAKIIFFWKKNLDPALFSNAEKCKKYLDFRCQRFFDRFERYLTFQTKVSQASAKFEKYQVFLLLEPEAKETCLKIYRLVKFWELNIKAKSLPQRETVRSLRMLINPEKALEHFRSYYQGLKKAMYRVSKQIKNPLLTRRQKDTVEMETEKLLGYRNELHTLGATLTKYREFLLRTDPNPYISSRIGFVEWVMGPEPAHTKQMLNLSYEIENLDSILEGFINSLVKKTAPSESTSDEVKSEILCLLHEMSQPLMSKPMMKLRAEHLIDWIEQLDELATLSPTTVEFVEQALIKGLRGDWRYQVLFNLPKFHRIFGIHQGIVGDIEDRSHLKRIEKFKQHIDQIEQWVAGHETPKHTDEIELEINDIKTYLQDFLAQVQRATQPEVERTQAQKHIRSIEHQLLEYRYLFGRFFHRLNDNHPEEKMLRYKFLFVDQYFESVENRILEWRSNAEAPNKA